MIHISESELQGLVHLKHRWHMWLLDRMPIEELDESEQDWLLESYYELRDKAIATTHEQIDFDSMLNALCWETDMSEEQVLTVMRLIVDTDGK